MVLFPVQFLEVNKAFRNILQEERILEETRKEQQNFSAKVAKIEKQLETAKKRGDQTKLQNLDSEASVVSRHINPFSACTSSSSIHVHSCSQFYFCLSAFQQGNLYNQLSLSVEAKSEKLELYKVAKEICVCAYHHYMSELL